MSRRTPPFPRRSRPPRLGMPIVVAFACTVLLGTAGAPALAAPASTAGGATQVVAAARTSTDPTLRPARRLSIPSLGAAGYAARVKQALRVLAHEHPEVLSAEAAAATSGYEVEAAKRARYPRFKFGTATGTYNSGAAGASSRSYELITAEARMSLIDGGAMSAKLRAAEAGSQAQGEAVKSTSQKVVLDALTAYLQVQRFELQKEIARRSTQVVVELSRVEERRVALGATGQNDLRMAAARRATIAAREHDFDAQRAEALAKFETYFQFRPEPASLPALAAPEAWRIASQEEALRRAEARSAELAEARGRIDRAQALVEQQEASLYPTVDAVIVKSKDPRGVSPSEPTRAALELNWSFGNGFDRQLRTKSALAEVANQEAKFEGVRRNLFELTAGAWNRAATGHEREKQLMEAVDESGQAFRGRRRLMEFGRETLPNVLDAQLDYYNLLVDYIDAVFDRRISELRLARATGELWVAPDSDNPWIDRLFGAPMRPRFGDDGTLGALCLGGGDARCGGEVAAMAPSAAQTQQQGLALKAAVRLREF